MIPALEFPGCSQETTYSLTGGVPSVTLEGTKPMIAEASPGVTVVMMGAVTGGIVCAKATFATKRVATVARKARLYPAKWV